jgi:glycosyltransferase involved in cell wall biosynthesis
MKKVLVVGHIPPPYGGQAIMTQKLLNTEFKNVNFLFLNFSFSHSFREMGRSSINKFLLLFKYIFKVYLFRFKYRNLILYYIPAGPNKIPIIRDIIFLFFIRFLFKKKIYHFRAAGLSDYLSGKNFFIKLIAKLTYGSPTIAIQLSELNPPDGRFLNAKKIYYIPNGIEDQFNVELSQYKKFQSDKINILFVSVLREDKGLTWLIKSLKIVRENISSSCELNIYIIGEFYDVSYEKYIHKLSNDLGLTDIINFVGSKIGHEKWEYFYNADMFCFPTFFESESFGNVLIEAMMFELPIITSNWRAIPEIVTEEVGVVIPVNDVDLLAQKIILLINNPILRINLGKNARSRYLHFYNIDNFINRMQTVFNNI